MKQTLRVLNWNVEANKQKFRNKRSEKVRQVIKDCDPDIVCLTEVYPHNLPIVGRYVTGQKSGWGDIEERGARRVILWSKSDWELVDPIGSTDFPEGRFVSAVTRGLRVVGVVIPYHAYRTETKWGANRKAMWQGGEEYLTVFHEQVLSQPAYHQKTIILGDFNLQIPARGYPKDKSKVDQLQQDTFARYHIPTAGDIDDPALDKPFIDHVALTPDLEVVSMKFISRFTSSGDEMSDHNGVVLEIRV